MKIVYDTKLKRPACVLLQAALGGDRDMAAKFNPDNWLVNPTENMHLYEVTSTQLKQLIAITKIEALSEDSKRMKRLTTSQRTHYP